MSILVERKYSECFAYKSNSIMHQMWLSLLPFVFVYTRFFEKEKKNDKRCLNFQIITIP